MQTDRKTNGHAHIMKPRVAFRDYANAPKNEHVCVCSRELWLLLIYSHPSSDSLFTQRRLIKCTSYIAWNAWMVLLIFKEAVTISQNFYCRKSAKILNHGGCIRTQDHQHIYENVW
jgi:hypothetical protein